MLIFKVVHRANAFARNNNYPSTPQNSTHCFIFTKTPYMVDVQPIDLTKIIKRLELIKYLIALNEEDEINSHIVKLEQNDQTSELASIITLLKEKAYSKAVTAIAVFISVHDQLVSYFDPEIEALKLEIKILADDIKNLSNEKADIEKLVHEFAIRHNQELGELIIKILHYRKQHAKGTPHHKQAEEDYKAYHQEYEASKDENVNTLTKEEQEELRDKYHKASKLCHPDVVSEEQKELANKLFAELSVAYKKNDINKVREILNNLKKGYFFISKSDAINEKQLLQAEMENLRLLIITLKDQIKTIKESDTYKAICDIINWDDYFANTKQQFQSQVDDLKGGE